MKYLLTKVDDLNIAYIGGGSKFWAWTLMGDLALQDVISGNVKLYDINFDAAYENEIIGNNLCNREETRSKWRYKAVRTLKEALKGADLVIISILPGTFHEMISDVHTPEEYGIYQSVGDSTGPGGLFRALRAIPMFVEFAESIMKYSPHAWVINYTNPMTLCVRTLYEVFPGIKAFGCCHEVFGVQDLLCETLKEIKGISGITRHDIKTNVMGVNHFTWINKATYKGMDIMPIYKEFVNRHYNEGYEATKDLWVDDPFSSANKVKFDLFRRYGLIAAAGDRHLAEFIPWYLRDIETVRKWKFGLTSARSRLEGWKWGIDNSKKVAAGEIKFELNKSGEEGINQIYALLGLGDIITNVNLPNTGQMAGIPVGAVVETNACFSADSVRPVLTGLLPESVQSLVIRIVLNQETILKAALKRDKELAFNAFLNDPLVTVSMNDARILFDMMLQNTKEYLPGWDIAPEDC